MCEDELQIPHINLDINRKGYEGPRRIRVCDSCDAWRVDQVQAGKDITEWKQQLLSRIYEHWDEFLFSVDEPVIGM